MHPALDELLVERAKTRGPLTFRLPFAGRLVNMGLAALFSSPYRLARSSRSPATVTATDYGFELFAAGAAGRALAGYAPLFDTTRGCSRISCQPQCQLARRQPRGGARGPVSFSKVPRSQRCVPVTCRRQAISSSTSSRSTTPATCC